MTLLAEDLLLLLFEDESGKPQVDSIRLDAALAGALIADLALAGYIEVQPLGPLGGDRVVVVEGPRPTDELLASVFDVVADKPRAPRDLITKLSRKRRVQVLQRLAARGLLEHREERVLGVFPRTRWPAVDATEEQEELAALRQALVTGTQPSPRTAALIGLLWAVEQAHKVVRDPSVARREIKGRAKELSRGDWVAKAVRDSAVAAQAAAAPV